MPYINIKMTKEDGGATKKQKEKLAKGIIKLFDDIFKRGGKTAVITIDEVATDNYFIGGESISKIRTKSSKFKKDLQ